MCMIGSVKGKMPKRSKVTGYRVFDRDNGRLKSYAMEYVYGAGWNRANRVPTERNKNGFWVFKTMAQAQKKFPHHDVYGEVELRSPIIEHEQGYRGNLAKVRGLVSRQQLTDVVPKDRMDTYRRSVGLLG